jgi:hypothetical protein
LLLAHEQLHFDISEIYARKIRKDFLELYLAKLNSISRYVDVMNTYLLELKKINNRLDSEVSDYSPPKEKDWEWTGRDEFLKTVANWQEMISKELTEQDHYALD